MSERYLWSHISTLIASLVLAFAPVVVGGTEMDPKEEVESLLNEGFPFAQQQLAEHGEFYPFAFALTTEGKAAAVGAHTGEERPDSAAVLSFLVKGLRKAARDGQYRAVALFVDVRVVGPGGDGKTDAVQAGLEHESGYCVDVFLPYEERPDGTVAYGELFASPREGSVFEACIVE